MVSFFGLKFGGDKKKVLTKPGNDKGPEARKGPDQPENAQHQFYGSSQQNDYPPRPGTSYSTKGPSNWRQSFRGFGANSSMVDLSAPRRKQSVRSLRHQPSQVNFKNPWMNRSTSNLPLPSSNGGAGPRVGAPERPSTSNARTKEWVNPLDIHFCKDSASAPPPSAPEGPAESLLALEFEPHQGNDDAIVKPSTETETTHYLKNEATHQNGYPSPPQSVSNSEQPLSPTASDLSMFNEKTNPTPPTLPSPAASAPRTSEEHWGAPVIRNALTKRDTTILQSPRRRSFTVDFEQQELEKLRKQRQTEGFAGSFADFDFGEIVTKQSSIEQLPEPPVSAVNVNPRHQPIASDPVESPRTPPSGRIGGAPTAAAGAHPGNGPERTFEPPPRLGFRARLGSDAGRRRKTGPPKPIQTTAPSQMQHDVHAPKSSFPTAFDNQAASNGTIQSVDSRPPNSSYQHPTTLKGNFPVTKGLPRGRPPPRGPPRSDDAPSPERQHSSHSKWGYLARAESKKSAMPPPLATSSQPRPSTSSGASMALSSPSLASFDICLSDSSESLAQAFEEALDKNALSSGLAGDFFPVDVSGASTTGTTRVEAKKAPPRPAPVTLPPSPKKSMELRPSPSKQREFSFGFI